MSKRGKKKEQGEKEIRMKRRGGKEKAHQLDRHHQQQWRRDQRRPEDAALVVEVVCPPLGTGRRGGSRRRRKEKLVPLSRRELVEPLPSADEGEAEGEDDALDSLVFPRGYDDEEERGVRGEQAEDERFLRSGRQRRRGEVESRRSGSRFDKGRGNKMEFDFFLPSSRPPRQDLAARRARPGLSAHRESGRARAS